MAEHARPAATAILLRDGAGGLETLLLRRNSRSSFAAGALVFPGGRVDDDDWEGVAAGDEVGVARRAAARETAEEAGVVLDPASLVPHSFWQPPESAPVRYLTWFFVAAAPDGVVAVDGHEIVDHLWLTPAEALERHARDEVELMPPTWVTLHGLTAHASTEEAVARARARQPARFQSRWVATPDGPVFLYAGDVGYEAAEPDLAAPGPKRRLDARAKPWRWVEADS